MQSGHGHRDLSPRNILIARDGSVPFVQIADFGLAKSFNGAGLSGVTDTGSFGGTLKFMPRNKSRSSSIFSRSAISGAWQRRVITC